MAVSFGAGLHVGAGPLGPVRTKFLKLSHLVAESFGAGPDIIFGIFYFFIVAGIWYLDMKKSDRSIYYAATLGSPYY